MDHESSIALRVHGKPAIVVDAIAVESQGRVSKQQDFVRQNFPLPGGVLNGLTSLRPDSALRASLRRKSLSPFSLSDQVSPAVVSLFRRALGASSRALAKVRPG
jgi:hypothetical protein